MLSAPNADRKRAIPAKIAIIQRVMMGIGQNSLTGPRVAVVAYNNLSLFEFGIAVEVFGLKRPEFSRDWYRFDVVSAEGASLDAIAGLTLNVSANCDGIENADIVVLPGWRAPYTDVPGHLIGNLRAAHASGCRIVAICGGAYILAATGLLHGKRATTHWRFVDHFARSFPNIDLDHAPLFCVQDNLYTSAGSAAGIDLCLHVVKQDYGLEKANEVAKRLVVSPLRSGEQVQDVKQPILPQDKHHRLHQILEKLKLDIAEGYTIDDAAALAGLTPRTFIRQFQKITGTSYGGWTSLQKLDRAKVLLKETDLSIEYITEACGYASSSSLRRLFKEAEGVSPAAYRRSSNA